MNLPKTERDVFQYSHTPQSIELIGKLELAANIPLGHLENQIEDASLHRAVIRYLYVPLINRPRTMFDKPFF